MSATLELTGIEKRFGARRVLTGVSLSAAGGHIVAVTGPNGTGKSTLLKIAAGLLRPTRGTVTLTLGGADCSEPALRRKSVGYVGQDVALYPELSGRENLEFFAQVRGEPKNRTELQAALESVGLGERGGDAVGVYSSGMRQRLRLALATLFAPKVLLLDEPGLALDGDGVGMLTERIAAFKASGAAVVLATNDPREAALGDAVCAVAP